MNKIQINFQIQEIKFLRIPLLNVPSYVTALLCLRTVEIAQSALLLLQTNPIERVNVC